MSDLNQMKTEKGELNIHDVLNGKNTLLSLSEICATEFLEVGWFWTHLWTYKSFVYACFRNYLPVFLA